MKTKLLSFTSTIHVESGETRRIFKEMKPETSISAL